MASAYDCVQMLKYRLSRHQDTLIDQYIFLELKNAQATLERNAFLPSFLLGWFDFEKVGVHDYFTANTEIDQDYIRLDDRTGLGVVDTEQEALWPNMTAPWSIPLVQVANWSAFLEKQSWEETNRGDADTYPTHYCVTGFSDINVWPTQSVTRRYVAYYYTHAETLTASPTTGQITSGSTNVWTKYAPELLMAQAGINIALYLRDPEAMQLFQMTYNKEFAKMLKADQARIDADQNYVMLED